MCFTTGSIVTMTICYSIQSVVLFACIVEAEYFAKDQRNPTTDHSDIGPLDQID